MPIQITEDDAKQPNPEPVPGTNTTFEQFANGLPETVAGFRVPASPEATPQADADAGEPMGGVYAERVEADVPPPPPRRRKSLKKLQKALEKLEGKIAKFPILWFEGKAKNQPEWALDEDEKELIRDSISTVFEVLDVGVDVEPISYVIRSVYWVLAYPFVAFLFLFLIKKGKELPGETEETKE